MVIIVDICLNFITDSYSDPGKETLNNKEIAYRYIRSYFIIDLASVLPSLVTFEKYKGTHWIYMLKLLRYFKIKRSFKQVEDLFKELGGVFKEHTSYNIRYVFITIFKFILIFHFMACIFIILGKCNDEDNLFFCGADQNEPL